MSVAACWRAGNRAHSGDGGPHASSCSPPRTRRRYGSCATRFNELSSSFGSTDGARQRVEARFVAASRPGSPARRSEAPVSRSGSPRARYAGVARDYPPLGQGLGIPKGARSAWLLPSACIAPADANGAYSFYPVKTRCCFKWFYSELHKVHMQTGRLAAAVTRKQVLPRQCNNLQHACELCHRSRQQRATR